MAESTDVQSSFRQFPARLYGGIVNNIVKQAAMGLLPKLIALVREGGVGGGMAAWPIICGMMEPGDATMAMDMGPLISNIGGGLGGGGV
ncbi:MAG: hypothetical protein R3D29_06865 [Nitratireductor sp.]